MLVGDSLSCPLNCSKSSPVKFSLIAIPCHMRPASKSRSAVHLSIFRSKSHIYFFGYVFFVFKAGTGVIANPSYYPRFADNNPVLWYYRKS